jgi:hypothetical protein
MIRQIVSRVYLPIITVCFRLFHVVYHILVGRLRFEARILSIDLGRKPRCLWAQRPMLVNHNTHLDLVGARMMVTLSSAIYERARFRGAMSRDIMLKQLTSSRMSRLAGNVCSALIVGRDGLAVDNRNPTGAGEMNQVNTKAGAAALYCGTAQGMKQFGTKGNADRFRFPSQTRMALHFQAR